MVLNEDELESSNEPKLWCSIKPLQLCYFCRTQKRKMDKAKVCHFQNQLCSNPRALAKTGKEQKKRFTNTNSEELNPHYNNIFSVIILKCCSISFMQHYTKKAIKSTLVHLLWEVFTFLYTFYFYSRVQKDKIHWCAGKMLWTHKAQGRC